MADRIILDGLEYGKLQEALDETARHSEQFTKMVADFSKPATQELDALMIEIYKASQEKGGIEMTIAQDYVMKLAAVMYKTTVAVESLGVHADMSETIYKDSYAQAMRNSQGKASKDRESDGELGSQYQRIVSDIRTRAYKVSKLKLEAGDKMHGTLKKIISAQMNEMALSRGVEE
jgi:hypothetical protein